MEQLNVSSAPIAMLERSGEVGFREQSTLRPYPRHALIYAPGESASHLYMVSHGEVKISRYTADGRELTLEHLGPGRVFGETELLLGHPRESQALARSECALYRMERDNLLALVAEDARFGMWLAHTMGLRQARMEHRMETLLFKSANGKVAQVLLKLAHDYGKDTAEGTLIDYPITHQEIGNLIATTRETVSYAFMEFRQRGLISTRQRRTIVLDLAELREAARA
jgi:CRP-like cAMP-binding protein